MLNFVRGLVQTLAMSCVLLIEQPGQVRAEAGAELASPDSPGSHEAFQQQTLAARTGTYRKALATYDAWLEANPRSVGGALERCKFVLKARDSAPETPGEGPGLKQPAGVEGACVDEVVRRFPNVPAALQFRIEHLGDEQAIAFGTATLRRSDVLWTGQQNALFRRQLAYAYFSQSRLREAVAEAIRARAQDPSIDVGLILATQFKRAGLRERAIAELAAHSDPTYALQKVDLLVEMAAFDQAFELIAHSATRGLTLPLLVHAQVLEAVGQCDAARAKYRELGSLQRSRREVLQRLFYLELRRRDRAKALAAYEALRDDGYGADPLLRHRLALVAAFPWAPWRARDLLGLFGILMVGLLTVALPAAIVLPVHYVGLLRGARAGPTTPLGDRWSLKHLWVISSLFLLASMSGAYLFAYDSLHALLFQAEEPALRSREAAQAGLFSVVGAAVAVLSFVRRHDYRQWIRGSWSPRQMLKPALAGLGVVFVVAVASQLLAYVLGWSHAGDWAGIGAGLTTMEVVRALRDVSGPWLLLPLLVVLVPVYEEIAFRGVFLASVGRHLPFAWANTLQASVFALIHDQIRHFPSLFAMGLIAGILTRRAGGLAPAIALHAAVNSATATAIYLVPLLATPDVEKEVKAAQPKPASPAELRKRCDAGNRVDCFQLGQRYSEGRGVPRDYATAASLLGKACDAEIGASCGRLGELHGAGLGVAKDDERAAQLFKRACDAGLPLHCEYLAIAYELGSGLPQDHSTASQLHKKACDSGYLRACSSLGRLYQLGSGVEKSTARAAQLYEKGCDDGDATGCDGLAGLHYYGDGVMQDFTLAAQLARKACDGGISRACGDLGWKYAHGEGVPQNLRTAAQFYQRACEGGDRARCANLGALYYLGSGVEKDHAQAERWFRLGCEHGDAHGCAELSGLYQRGEGVQRDAAGAWQLLEKACAAGLDNARCHRRPHAP